MCLVRSPLSGRARVSSAESTVLLPRQPRVTVGLVIGLWGEQPVVTAALVKTCFSDFHTNDLFHFRLYK